MSKSDAAMKRKLDQIGDVGKLKRRRFIDSSSQDQELWSNNGLSFGINGLVYGSCDFAWYANESWQEKHSNRLCKEKPYLVIEATDCLNTRSWGSAQIQRFHHALGSFLCGIDSVYYLNKGPTAEMLRPYLCASAYFATFTSRNYGNKASYLVTTEIDDVKKLVNLLDNKGKNSPEFKKQVEIILEEMISYFNKTFLAKPYYGNWGKYLESRKVFRQKNRKWVKIIGAKEKSFSDSTQRYGHIVLGEAITSKYLLAASGCFNVNQDVFSYLMPLLNSNEISNLDKTKKTDKEWQLLRKSDKSWKIIGFDKLVGVDPTISRAITQYRTANLNKVKKGWNDVKNKIENGLKTGTITIAP